MLVGGRRAQRMAGERRDRGGLGALALDVADQRRPAAVAGAVEVVEVAAELDALAGGVEAHGGGEAGHGGQRARPQRALQRARDRALAAVEAGVGDRPRRELAELGEDRVVAAAELALGRVDDLERAELAALRLQADARARRCRRGDLEVRGRGRAERRAPRLGGQDRDRGALRRERRAGRVGGELEDLLGGQRGVDRHRGVGQRAQLLDVLVLDARDLLHLVVAAGRDLERGEALAQELRGRADDLALARRGRGGERGGQRAVVRVGEVEHAVLRRDRLAAERVGGPEAALAALAEVGRERRGVALRESGRRRHVWLLDPHAAKPIRAVQDPASARSGRAGARRSRARRRGSRRPA